MAAEPENALFTLFERTPREIYCRICLCVPEVPYRRIFEPFNKSQSIVEVIEEFAQVEILGNDKHSNLICLGCLEKLEAAVNLQIQIKEAEIKLRDLEPTIIDLPESHEADYSDTESEDLCENDDDDGDTTPTYVIETDEIVLPNINLINNNSITTVERNESIFLKEVQLNDEMRKKLNELRRSQIDLPKITVVNSSDVVETPIVKSENAELYTIDLVNNGVCVLKPNLPETPPVKFTRPRHGRGRPKKPKPERKESKLPRTHECPECKETIKGYKNLRAHCKIHDSFYRYRCSICNKGFWHKFHRDDHEELHKDIKRDQCEICGKTFKRRLLLISHKAVHSKAKFQCHQCGKIFSMKNTLKNHLSTHKDQFPYECRICGRKFKTSSQRGVHIRTHRPINREKCHFCGKFVRRLIAHLKQHTRPCKCDSCNLSFPDNSALKRHKSSHSDERPFPCKVCGKSFKNYSTLWTHERKHNISKYETCELCGKRFMFKFLLRRHLDKVHLAEPVDTTIVTDFEIV